MEHLGQGGTTAAAATDAQVVAASLDDPARFAELFDRHYEAVHRYAQRRVGFSAADEVAAETFLRAFDRRVTFDGAHADALPWLFGIATNVLRGRWRTERRRLAAHARSLAPASAAGPEVRSLAVETARALRHLRRDEREALLLYAWGELTYQEIASALAIPVGTVRSRLSRARGRLRRTLGGSAATPSIAEEVSRV